jgi:Protein of unknown function (DUF2794)
MDDTGGQGEAETQNVVSFSAARNLSMPVMFDRKELNLIFNIYGQMVGAGEWKDYGIDSLGDCAVFSVFRRSGEYPLYRIEKHPKLARKQGAFSVVNANGFVLKRGHELGPVLRVFDKSLRVVE